MERTPGSNMRSNDSQSCASDFLAGFSRLIGGAVSGAVMSAIAPPLRSRKHRRVHDRFAGIHSPLYGFAAATHLGPTRPIRATAQ
jgi:hypothetical protein